MEKMLKKGEENLPFESLSSTQGILATYKRRKEKAGALFSLKGLFYLG